MNLPIGFGTPAGDCRLSPETMRPGATPALPAIGEGHGSGHPGWPPVGNDITPGPKRGGARGTSDPTCPGPTGERGWHMRDTASLFGPPGAAAIARTPARAAEALLHGLAQRPGSGRALDATARALRGPLLALLATGPADPAARAEARRLVALIDELLEVTALEAGMLRARPAPVSVHRLLGTIASRLSTFGIGCGRRITLQPDAVQGFFHDAPRLARALSLLAARAASDCGGAARAELSIDVGAGGARLVLVVSPAAPLREEEPAPEALLTLSVARRMVAVLGGCLDARVQPGGGLRACLVLGGA